MPRGWPRSSSPGFPNTPNPATPCLPSAGMCWDRGQSLQAAHAHSGEELPPHPHRRTGVRVRHGPYWERRSEEGRGTEFVGKFKQERCPFSPLCSPLPGAPIPSPSLPCAAVPRCSRPPPGRRRGPPWPGGLGGARAGPGRPCSTAGSARPAQHRGQRPARFGPAAPARCGSARPTPAPQDSAARCSSPPLAGFPARRRRGAAGRGRSRPGAGRRRERPPAGRARRTPRTAAGPSPAPLPTSVHRDRAPQTGQSPGVPAVAAGNGWPSLGRGRHSRGTASPGREIFGISSDGCRAEHGARPAALLQPGFTAGSLALKKPPARTEASPADAQTSPTEPGQDGAQGRVKH